jgi:hypothetical protein
LIAPKKIEGALPEPELKKEGSAWNKSGTTWESKVLKVD